MLSAHCVVKVSDSLRETIALATDHACVRNKRSHKCSHLSLLWIITAICRTEAHSYFIFFVISGRLKEHTARAIIAELLNLLHGHINPLRLDSSYSGSFLEGVHD
jgi:hypothetical protein